MHIFGPKIWFRSFKFRPYLEVAPKRVRVVYMFQEVTPMSLDVSSRGLEITSTNLEMTSGNQGHLDTSRDQGEIALGDVP